MHSVSTIAAVVFITAWFCDGFLDNAWVNGPRQSSPDTSHTIPYAVKGITVYITTAQRQMMDWLIRIEIGAGGILAVGIVMSGCLLWRRPHGQI